MSKKSISITACILIVFLTACSPKVTENISWQEVTPVIDGQINEYKDLPYFSGEGKVFFQISNNQSHLFLNLKIIDKQLQFQALKGGMEVWLDTTKKSTRKTGILFPLASAMDIKPEMPKELSLRKKPDPKTMLQDLIANQISVELKGFKNLVSGTYPINNKSGIEVRLGIDSQEALIYETAIPFSTFYKNTIAEQDTASVFSMTIKILAPEMPSRPIGDDMGSPSPMGGGNMGPGGMGNPYRGEMQQGPMGNPEGMNQQKTKTIQKRFHLSLPCLK